MLVWVSVWVLEQWSSVEQLMLEQLLMFWQSWELLWMMMKMVVE